MKKEESLELRRNIKKKKPKFIRQDAHKSKKLAKNWRRPKGLQSKMRLRLKGYRKRVSSGYRSPILVRNLSRSGLKEVVVNNIKDIEVANQEKDIGIIISKRVGTKNKVNMLKKCIELKLKVLNIKDIEKLINKVEEKVKKKKQEKEEKKKEKSKKKKEREKFAKEKEEKEKQEKNPNKEEEKDQDELTSKIMAEEKEEDKKKKEKQEKDKVLIKKD